MTDETAAETAAPPLEELPEVVRARVVALSAEVLPDVVRLPPALRRVATFTASRRARLGGTAIAEALEADEEFRERVAGQLAGRATDGATDGAPDAARQAALAWITRPEGWPTALEDAVRRLAERPATVRRETEEAERLRARLADAEQALRDQRARQRVQVEEYKSENANLRRKLGDARAAERAARAEAEQAAQALAEAESRLEAQGVAQDKELRRLRAQVAQWEAEATAERRAGRGEREDASLRARLLLDTLIDAATGLRRELALPAASGAPGDRVEAELLGQEAGRAVRP